MGRAGGEQSWSEDERAADLRRARDIVGGAGATTSPHEMVDLADRLLLRDEPGLARRLLRRARDRSPSNDFAAHARRRHALATYKDPDAPLLPRLTRALEILAQDEDLETTDHHETLGIAGAIHKRRWEATMRPAELELALGYYLRAIEPNLAADGHAAANAAFVLDLLADVNSRAGAADAGVEARRRAADEIRRRMVEQLAPRAQARPDDWWLQASLAEAHLGLGEYAQAERLLARCGEIDGVATWQLESTARQVGALATLRARTPEGDLEPGADAALKALLGGSADAVTSTYAGKLGLALSGGGFRASFFHIGLLAHLAEVDVLRHVEVLSCVSGGSIVGAHYYLELQRVLEGRDDDQIGRDDYVEIVRRVEREFLAGVRSNIRMRVVGSPHSNLWSAIWPGWTRTRRAGRAYERRLYARVEGGHDRSPRHMEDLLVAPADAPERDDSGRPLFRPRRDNWRRRCKVPILVLNAATLNTGHNWQFTASWMGEPPAVVDEEVDPNPRLRRMSYEHAPKPWRRVRLGEAVAASACVPGLFEPFAMRGLYPDTVVRLVDGGVHDNQGIASLVEQDCDVVLISDASGQLTHQDSPGAGPLTAALRAGSVLGARVREAQLRDLLARRAASALRGLAVVHLRKGLAEPPKDWIDCTDPYVPEDDVARAEEERASGVPPDIQALLAGIRTDLDAFSDIEARTLMLAGYRMAQRTMPDALAGFPLEQISEEPSWDFLVVEPALCSEDPRRQRLERVLEVASARWFKAWRLVAPLRWAGIALSLVTLVAIALALWTVRDVPLLTPGAVLAATVGLGIAGLVSRFAATRFDPAGSVARVTLGVALLLAAVPAWVQLHLLDRAFLRAGRTEDG